MEKIIIEMTSLATIAIVAFGILLSLTQTPFPRVRLSFAAFLAAVAANNLSTGLTPLLEALGTLHVVEVDLVLGLATSLCLAPLFWIYVVAVTSSTDHGMTTRLLHFALPGLAAMAGFLVLIAPRSVRDVLFAEGMLPASPYHSTLIILLVLLHLAIYPQMAIYLILIVKRMHNYRKMLRDLYASTERHELRWMYSIAVLGGVFWFANAAIVFVSASPSPSDASFAFTTLSGLTGLGLATATTLWGLRQQPPLMSDQSSGDMGPVTRVKPTNAVSPKYEKSALSNETTARLSRKLRKSMEVDHLHRDPNLSLWTLSRHIGASPNYISQTLNEEIKETFFDFVNGYRISDAKDLLERTDQTVLQIAYEVGFNARSSFYNSFKRRTGVTPTQYRHSLSDPSGMDDAIASN
ncbi:helix-turn-helix domain-containing protein [Pontivivens insulae]|uniref:HTH-type transcriptional regulator n=1 Tax=Pontivivens insulae TaxID=1639689 RepID=A0A2R8AFU9_9RHOB|nr:AraC family transcriptional regulator [Pontivivens insulae]RED10664.1 AraC family transcriptional regulator [Pontivivens insulae]SPF31124.1 HTH-type transcriptional regulator [Pontivivens insulae]